MNESTDEVIKQLRDEVIEEVARFVETFDGRVHPLDIADKIREELKK